jgi:Mrp family chromosome partitioning ATPase
LLFATAAAALGVGLLLGLALVLLRDQLDQRVSTLPALNELLGWPLLAELSAPAVRQGSLENGAPGETPALQAYQTLDKNLAFSGLDAPLFSIVLTSALRDGAANAVAGNLALFLAGGGKRVLLVDANFSRPSQSRRFGLASEPGLSDAVLAFNAPGDAEPSLQPYIHHPQHAPSSLQVLPAGAIPPHPGRVLQSQAMKAVFQAFPATGADVVVLVAPPVTSSADISPFAAQADGTVVMVERAHARRDKLVRVKRILEEAGTRVLGYIACESASLSQTAPAEHHGKLENVQIG